VQSQTLVKHPGRVKRVGCDGRHGFSRRRRNSRNGCFGGRTRRNERAFG
jgi:hypothetical protein